MLSATVPVRVARGQSLCAPACRSVLKERTDAEVALLQQESRNVSQATLKVLPYHTLAQDITGHSRRHACCLGHALPEPATASAVCAAAGSGDVWHASQALSTRKATVTPLWAAMWVMIKYRTRNNYCSSMYMFGRLFDKVRLALGLSKTSFAEDEPGLRHVHAGYIAVAFCTC